MEFNGDEAAATETVANRATTRRSPKINIQDEHSICVHAEFCGTRLTNVCGIRKDSQNPEVAAQIINMIDNCLSGALTYSLARDETIIKPDSPRK